MNDNVEDIELEEMKRDLLSDSNPVDSTQKDWNKRLVEKYDNEL